MEHAAKYDEIGVHYDATRRADPFLSNRLAHHLEVINQSRCLDLACGSGNYTVSVSKFGGSWVAVDQSAIMLDKASQKSNAIEWRQGDASALPFKDKSFDRVMCTLAIHHFPSIPKAFSEILRVLDDSGRFVLFTSSSEQISNYWLNEYFPLALKCSSEQMPSLTFIEEALTQTGFKILMLEPYFVHKQLEDLFLYCGKHRPELYLDPRVRNGISTFSSLANPKEVESGCKKLSEDILSERINQVISVPSHESGDYCFVVCEKSV